MKFAFPFLVLLLFAVSSAPAAPPERDLTRWVKSWESSPTTISHGNLAERVILSPGDPLNPPSQGAVLKYLSRLNRGVMYGMGSTKATKHDGENEMLYIVSGKGRIAGGGKSLPLKPGDAVLIPPAMEHTIVNETAEPLVMVVAAEPVPKDFTPRADIFVRSMLDSNASAGAHWNHIGYGGLSRNDGLCQLEGFALVGVDGMNIAEPHPHVAGTEEIWYNVSGDAFLHLGTRLFRQPEGTAFLTPPDGQTPHATINTSDKPVLFLFLARWKDRQ